MAQFSADASNILNFYKSSFIAISLDILNLETVMKKMTQHQKYNKILKNSQF